MYKLVNDLTGADFLMGFRKKKPASQYSLTPHKNINMGPWDSNNEQVLPLATEWINKYGPLYVDDYMPHSGGPGVSFLICELFQLLKLIDAANPGSVITIYKDIFVLRGYFDKQMHASFQDQFSEGEYWWVLEGTFYPDKAEILASGSSWSIIEHELMDETERLNNVFIGKEPDIPNYWIENNDENILILRKKG